MMIERDAMTGVRHEAVVRILREQLSRIPDAKYVRVTRDAYGGVKAEAIKEPAEGLDDAARERGLKINEEREFR